MRKTLIIGAALVLGASQAQADESVQGYYRSDGTYVQPHYRSSPNRNPYDNYSTQGNVNPYTGQQGYITPNSSYPFPPLPSMPPPPTWNYGQ